MADGKLKLALGCGKRYYGEDWQHIDGANFPHVMSHSITELPYADNSVDVIFSCHVIAYFDREGVQPLLKEWHRVLKLGGVLRIATPDFERMAEMYLNNNCHISQIIGPLYGRMKMNEQFIYHKNTFDYVSLIRLFNLIGFHSWAVYDHNKTEHSMIDDHSAAYLNGQLISLNVEAVK